jgi:hypothetical protein
MTRRSRRDLTDAMTGLAAERSARLDVDGYVFKAKSPSCGIHGIPLYAGDAAVTRHNRGMFADVVIEAQPMLPVEDEGRLNDAGLREAFTERIFASPPRRPGRGHRLLPGAPGGAQRAARPAAVKPPSTFRNRPISPRIRTSSVCVTTWCDRELADVHGPWRLPASPRGYPRPPL